MGEILAQPGLHPTASEEKILDGGQWFAALRAESSQATVGTPEERAMCAAAIEFCASVADTLGRDSIALWRLALRHGSDSWLCAAHIQGRMLREGILGRSVLPLDEASSGNHQREALLVAAMGESAGPVIGAPLLAQSMWSFLRIPSPHLPERAFSALAMFTELTRSETELTLDLAQLGLYCLDAHRERPSFPILKAHTFRVLETCARSRGQDRHDFVKDLGPVFASLKIAEVSARAGQTLARLGNAGRLGWLLSIGPIDRA
ncbi:MAG: hypothetical protein Q8N26_17780 [Myxococcales bacterium]|nr:hypothetical protein [Myxococcales bacterium]